MSCYVMTCHAMLYNISHVMLCYVMTCVMLCYIIYVISCYVML